MMKLILFSLIFCFSIINASYLFPSATFSKDFKNQFINIFKTKREINQQNNKNNSNDLFRTPLFNYKNSQYYLKIFIGTRLIIYL